MKLYTATVHDLDDLVTNSIQRDIGPYCTALVGVEVKGGVRKASLIGSGTYVKISDKYCILTAAHVIESKRYKDCSELGLTIGNSPNQFSISKDLLRPLQVARGSVAKNGPDIGVIIIPAEYANQIMVSKSFWDIGLFREKLLFNWANLQYGAWIMHGCPEELLKEEFCQNPLGNVKSYECIIGFAGVVSAWTREKHDYYEYRVSYGENETTPQSFAGASGGGLWHVEIFQNPDGNFGHKRPMLSGVAYYETEVENNERSIFFHGRRSVYDTTYRAIAEVGKPA